MSKKTKSLYMHVINGLPATFDGTRIILRESVGGLAATLNQLEAEQKASIRWCAKRGVKPPGYGYGYVRIPIKAIKKALEEWEGLE